MTILISGGHLTPALALIDFIQQTHPQDKIIFVGRLYSQDKLKQLSQEKSEIESRSIKFYSLITPRISDLFSWKMPIVLIRLLKAVFTVNTIIDQEKPDVVMSFGGYLAIPIALAGWTKKIKLITHEQTRIAGSANRLIGNFAQKIGLAFSETAKYFPLQKTRVIGMPLRMELFQTSPQPDWITASIKHPILYITGGNQGSLFINQLIAQNLPQLTNLFFIIHQCGNPIATQDYQQQLLQARAQLPIEKQANYLVKPWVSQNELAWVYQHTDVVISRAGANSIAELASYELPAILIPLPKSSHQEQQANAEWYQAHFPAKILDQHQITAGQLLANLNELTKLERTKINLSTIRSNQEKVLADLYEMMKL